jgi:reactive intermediate/imine deaminase
MRRVFENLRAVCEAAGGDLSNLVKLNIYLVDLANFSSISTVMEEYFSQPYPARAAIGVKQLPLGAEVEMDGVMVI